MKSFSVVMVVMMLYYRRYILINDMFYNFRADVSMDHNMFVFRRREFTRLVLNRVIDGDFTYVVKQAAPTQVFKLFLR